MPCLIIYYSRKGENYVNGAIRSLEKGNTERVAEFIQKAVGGDLFEIKTVRTYAGDYRKCIEEAQAEQRANARPELESYIEDVSAYDVIFVGYPNWWGTCPMAVFSQLERLDLKGKVIAPFCTNEGSGMGSSESDLKKVCKGAKFVAGLSIHGAEADQSAAKVTAWTEKIGVRC